jgi:hypothetical protein
MVLAALGCGAAMLLQLPKREDPKEPVPRVDHGEEMSIREQMKTLQASNDEILALLKADRTHTGEIDP